MRDPVFAPLHPMSTTRAPILLVDDNDDMRQLQRTFLALRGHEVVLAEDAPAALRLLEDGLRPSLILLDFHLPGMNGRAFRDAQRARDLAADVPLVLYSGDLAVDGIGMDATAVLLYPIDLKELAAVVDGLVAQS